MGGHLLDKRRANFFRQLLLAEEAEQIEARLKLAFILEECPKLVDDRLRAVAGEGPERGVDFVTERIGVFPERLYQQTKHLTALVRMVGHVMAGRGKGAEDGGPNRHFRLAVHALKQRPQNDVDLQLTAVLDKRSQPAGGEKALLRITFSEVADGAGDFRIKSKALKSSGAFGTDARFGV